MKRVLVSGGDGKFAKKLKEFAPKDLEVLLPPKNVMNVEDFEQVDYMLDMVKPDYFIHAAALTRPMSLHEEKPYTSVATNIVGTGNVVLACMKRWVKLIYISTDYVYPGDDGNYSEEDALLPFTKYGWSKLGGECSVHIYDNSLILRMCMANKPFPHKKALVDVTKSLLYDEEAAKITLQLMDENGIINVGGRAETVYEFARRENPDVEKAFLQDVEDVAMGVDSSMDITKLESII
tara:strand:- start:13149 stop:13856 length:708 start_codon:yes stop_codon:yes gene_type:complete